MVAMLSLHGDGLLHGQGPASSLSRWLGGHSRVVRCGCAHAPAPAYMGLRSASSWPPFGVPPRSHRLTQVASSQEAGRCRLFPLPVRTVYSDVGLGPSDFFLDRSPGWVLVWLFGWHEVCGQGLGHSKGPSPGRHAETRVPLHGWWLS